MEIFRTATAWTGTIALILLSIQVPVLIQSALIKRDLWTVAIIAVIIEFALLWPSGIIGAIYTAFKWDKKKKQTNTPPEV